MAKTKVAVVFMLPPTQRNVATESRWVDVPAEEVVRVFADQTNAEAFVRSCPESAQARVVRCV